MCSARKFYFLVKKINILRYLKLSKNEKRESKTTFKYVQSQTPLELKEKVDLDPSKNARKSFSSVKKCKGPKNPLPKSHLS